MYKEPIIYNYCDIPRKNTNMSNFTNETPAVRVTDGYKNYGKSVVLQGLDMRVPRGVTYALLGSSGCGKTTLLSSIVGLQKLNSGSVQIYGHNACKADRSLVGYMPQESGLHAELTVSEELHFFGRLYGMEWTVVEDRVHFLVKLLQLPGESCIIQNLSGGETRRVSLAVALLHKPLLLILDEATVGVDPLLRQSIWEHLYKLVKEESCTIICSTHYTEEARQADIVSVMRNGQLLVEDNPKTLLIKFGSTLLEDVVLRLCHSQELEQYPNNNDMNSWDIMRDHDTDGSIRNISYKRRDSKDNFLDAVADKKKSVNSFCHLDEFLVKSTKNSRFFRHLQTIYAMFILHVIKFMRFPSITILLVTTPATVCLISYAVYSPEPHPNIGVVNLEQPDCYNLPPAQHKLGCELIFFLQHDDKLELEPFVSEKSASTAVHLGQNLGYLVIPNNFTANSLQRLAFGRFANKATLDGSSIQLYLDLSHHVRNLFLLEGLGNGYKAFAEEKLKTAPNDTDKEIILASLSPFKFNTKLDKILPVEATWYDKGSIMAVVSYILILPTSMGIAIVWDKKRGVFQRAMIGGGGLAHLIISAVWVNIFVYLGQIVLFVGSIKLLGIPFQGSIVDILLLNYGQHLIGLTLGILVGLVVHQELEMIMFVLGFFMVTSVAGAGYTTLESLNYWTKIIVVSLPTKLVNMGLENILFKGWTVFNPAMWSCFVNQGAWIISSLCLNLWAYYAINF